MQKYFLHFFVAGAVLGSLLFSFGANNLVAILFVLICPSIICLSLMKKGGRKITLLAILLLVAALTIYRGNSTFETAVLPNMADQKVSIVGKVSNEPDIRDTTTRLIIEVDYMSGDRGSRKMLNEKLIAITSHYPERQIGDALSLIGTIQVPDNFENENGIEFDYINYLAKDRIYSLMYYPRVENLNGLYGSTDSEKSLGIKIEQKIFLIKKLFLEKIQSIMPSPESELLGGILLGTKRSLGADLEEKFRRTGLIHIVVLSGYNVTIIAEAIFRFFGFLPRIFATTLGVISILVFMVMVGSGATVVRATIMALLALTARISGRTYGVNRALFAAGAIMIIHNPMVLIYDPSFQLSFLATVGLINFGEFVKKGLRFIPEKFELREISTATLSTQLAVFPLLMKMTGELSVVAPIVNILTLQVIPITMLLGFIAGLIGFVSQSVGVVAALLPYLFLKYVLVIVDFFSGFSFATYVF